MICHFYPSLQHMTCVKIALAIYYCKDIENILEEEILLPVQSYSLERARLELWNSIEKKTVEKLSFLPKLLHVKISKCIRPLHLETMRWIYDHKKLLKLNTLKSYLNCMKILCWKSSGIIDRIKTAVKLVHNNNIDAKTRFLIACTYFMEGEIFVLWYGDNEVKKMDIPLRQTNAAVRFWMEYIRGGFWVIKSWKLMINEYFELPNYLPDDMPLRASCFFPFLSWEAKKEYFPLLRDCGVFHQDDFRLCMQILDERERAEMLSIYPTTSLYTYLEWPFQSLFKDMSHQLWRHMKTHQFHGVLDRIIMYYNLKGLDDVDYLELLREFWHLIPTSFKDEIKAMEKYFKVIEVALNYSKENTSLSLPETLAKCMTFINSL